MVSPPPKKRGLLFWTVIAILALAALIAYVIWVTPMNPHPDTSFHLP